MTKKTKEHVFNVGEEVWYYPLKSIHPNFRRKVKIVGKHRTPYGMTYRINEDSILPVYNFPSVFEKIKKKVLGEKRE